MRVQHTDELSPAEKFQITMELFENGVRIMRQNLKREFPQASESEIDERLKAWLRHRPGAEHGDCPGPVREWPLKRR